MTVEHQPATPLPKEDTVLGECEECGHTIVTPLKRFPLPFPVVNGMVAIEHVRYLMDDRAKLVEALRLIARPALGGKLQQYAAQEILHELGESE